MAEVIQYRDYLNKLEQRKLALFKAHDDLSKFPEWATMQLRLTKVYAWYSKELGRTVRPFIPAPVIPIVRGEK